MNALDSLDLSKEAAAVGMDQSVAKDFIRATIWRLFEANAGHVILSVWGFHVTWNYARGPLALLIGAEPTLPAA